MPTIEPLQTLLDIAVQHSGTLANVFGIAADNGNISITDDLTPGDGMEVNATADNTEKRVLDYYNKNGIHPATGNYGFENGIQYDLYRNPRTLHTTLLMARTINDIFNALIAEKEATPGLEVLTSTSNVSIWRLLLYVVAVCQWTVENLYEISTTQQTAFIKQQKIHSLSWYSSIGKDFQLGYNLPWGETEYDNTGVSDEDIAASKIIKYCAANKVPGGISIKVATINDQGDLDVVPAPAFEAFKAYMFRCSAAGDNISDFYINQASDDIKLNLTIFYDPLILDSTGKRLDGTNDTPVQDGIDTYLKGIDFDGGRLIPAELEDALQAIPGVSIPNIDLLQTRSAALPFTNVPPEGVIPVAGYVRFADDTDLQITFTPAP